jgi:hypothetical protein
VKKANEVSAPGPSGQTIAFFKLLLLAIPNVMTKALNQLVFVLRLLEAEDFRYVLAQKKLCTFLKYHNPPSPL